MNHHNLHTEVQTFLIISIYNLNVHPITPAAALSLVQSVKMHYFVSTFYFIKICFLTYRFKKPVLHL